MSNASQNICKSTYILEQTNTELKNVGSLGSLVEGRTTMNFWKVFHSLPPLLRSPYN